MGGTYKRVGGWEEGVVDVVLYPDPEQGSGYTKLKSLVLITENVVINQIEDNNMHHQ